MDAQDRALLQKLIDARGPSGDEREVRDVCRGALEPICDEVWEDPVGNLVGLIRCADAVDAPVLIVSHMDEIAMMVKRVEEDGRLTVTNLGGDEPMSFGQCAVDILGDHGSLPGVLSLGSLHRTEKSPAMAAIEKHGPTWNEVFIATGRTRDELERAGVHPGTWIVLAASNRRIVELGDFLAAHFIDDRALVLAGVLAMRNLHARRRELRRDVYYVCSVEEEVTNAGAKYAAQSLPGDRMIALEVGPVADEYGTVISPAPILSYGDQKGLYSPKLIDELREACRAEGVEPQLAVLERFASDASASLSSGLKPEAAVMCVPTQNTHGFEIIHRDAVGVFAQVLTRFLLT